MVGLLDYSEGRIELGGIDLGGIDFEGRELRIEGGLSRIDFKFKICQIGQLILNL